MMCPVASEDVLYSDCRTYTLSALPLPKGLTENFKSLPMESIIHTALLVAAWILFKHSDALITHLTSLGLTNEMLTNLSRFAHKKP